MMKTEEIVNNVDSLLTDRGLVKEYKEQAVRLLLYHLYVAIDIYRYMTVAERNKAGYWYRIFKGSYTLRNFLKERKRKRDKEKSPLHPSYKKESGVKDKAQNPSLSPAHVKRTLQVRQEEFWNELLTFEGTYDLRMLRSFYYYWAEKVTGRRKMRLELETSWDTQFRLAAWSKRSFNKNDEAAAIRLERAKNGGKAKRVADDAEQQAIAAKRAEDNAKLEQEIKARKEGAVSYEEFVRQKNKTTT